MIKKKNDLYDNIVTIISSIHESYLCWGNLILITWKLILLNKKILLNKDFFIV